MNAFNLAIIMFLLIVVGFFSRRRSFIDEKFGQGLSVFLFNIVFPAIIISSMSIDFDKNDMNNSIKLILISIGTMVIMFLVALVVNALTHKKDNLAGIIKFAMMFPNFTFMAFPIMETLFPDKGLFYISMYTIPTRLFIYIIGPLLMKKKSESHQWKPLMKNTLKALVTPPVLAVPVGFLLYLTGYQLPIAISETLLYLARVATPMGMVLSGIILADVSLRSIFKEKRLYLLTFLRLIVAPIIIYFVLLPFQMDPIVFKISVLYCALPIASSTTVFAIQYENDPGHAAGGVFLTTVISIITIPICAYILELVV